MGGIDWERLQSAEQWMRQEPMVLSLVVPMPSEQWIPPKTKVNMMSRVGMTGVSTTGARSGTSSTLRFGGRVHKGEGCG